MDGVRSFSIKKVDRKVLSTWIQADQWQRQLNVVWKIYWSFFHLWSTFLTHYIRSWLSRDHHRLKVEPFCPRVCSLISFITFPTKYYFPRIPGHRFDIWPRTLNFEHFDLSPRAINLESTNSETTKFQLKKAP